MTNHTEMTIAPHLEEIRLVGTRVREISESVLSPKDSAQMELCVVEALNNIVKHGAKDDFGEPVVVSVDIEVEGNRLKVSIKDNGPGIPGDKLETSLNYDPLDLATLPESGMGLFIISQFVDNLSYDSVDGTHLMTLTKNSG